MSNFLKRTKRASEEIAYDKAHGINKEQQADEQTIEWYAKLLNDKDLEISKLEQENERLKKRVNELIKELVNQGMQYRRYDQDK